MYVLSLSSTRPQKIPRRSGDPTQGPLERIENFAPHQTAVEEDYLRAFLSLAPKSEDQREGRTQLYSLPTTALFRWRVSSRNTSLWSLGRLLKL